MPRPSAGPRHVALHSLRAREAMHERETHGALARRLAALLKADFVGDYDAALHTHPGMYLVPSDTLVGPDWTDHGMDAEDRLFGGVVPFGFLATKAITHPLVVPHAHAPRGWSPAFGASVRDSVLAGLTAFTHADALAAGHRLLQDGPVRIKAVRASAGRGQEVVRTPAALTDALAALDAGELAEYGIVLEEDLSEVSTYSIGQVRVGGLQASYYGVQRLTRDNRGELVYGGSALHVARGGFDALAALRLPPAVATALAQARAYDEAATRCYPGLIASRRNYDTVAGRNARGEWRAGVLEQSWRIGGASGAEVLALEALANDPTLACTQAATLELFGAHAHPPPNAVVLFHGVDDEMGPLLKCAVPDIPPHFVFPVQP